MTGIKSGSAAALSVVLACLAAPAYADDRDRTILAIGQRAAGHGPVGIMGDHVHRGGELMIGLTWLHEEYRGTNQRGTSDISDAAIAAAGYSSRVKSMTMDMAMLHLMWAPNDRVTFMIMPHWMRMGMTMVGVGEDMHGQHGTADGPDGHGHHDHNHHALMPGETMSHSVSGFGDTEVAALVSIARSPALSAHAGLAVSIPTGSVSRKNHDGTFAHYGMQGGSGTWDLIPSLTVTGGSEAVRLGGQVRYRFRAENRNKSGFRFGDRFDATAWAALPLSPAAAITARASYRDEGKIEGHYNGPHHHSSPPDVQENYGGQIVEAGVGGNLVVGGRWRIGVEGTLPIHQDLNGIQAPKDFGVNLNLSTMF